MIILEGNHIKKNYKNHDMITPVLKDVSIALQEGEFVAIMGKSGSGKSTLLHILSTLDTPDEGEVFFEGKNIASLNEEEAAGLRRQSFGFIFQSPKMVKNLSILDNILLPSLEYLNNKKATIEKALFLMKKVGVEEIAHKKISQVSGGQLQRAGICRALMNDPKIVFADEPTGALDSKSGQEVMELFSMLHAEGKTLLLVTHDIQVASRAERLLIMKDGQLQTECSKAIR